MKKIAGTLRLTHAQYRELAAFAQFGSDLDKATLSSSPTGRAWSELLEAGSVSADAGRNAGRADFRGDRESKSNGETYVRRIPV